MLIDTHCHIHSADYPIPAKEVLKQAHEAGVERMICIGTDEKSSAEAVEFAAKYKETYAAVGVHPHNTKDGWQEIKNLLLPSDRTLEASKIVGVGEIGLDYFYMHSPKEVQIKAFEEQLDFAVQHNLPVSFHVRDAFDDFWPIFDNFHNVRGVLHSFTDTMKNAQEGMKRGLYIGVNGISTFTKDESQKALFAELPLDRLLLETDAPFLAPAPWRGKTNQPAFVREIAEHHAMIRKIAPEEVASATTTNARNLFGI